jgi:tetratricopeptide (TPR) repeat protein
MKKCIDVSIRCAPLTVLLLAACASAPAPEPVPPPPPARDWVGEIRARAESVPSYVEVLPLSDPGVADLRSLAKDAEAARRFDEADRHLALALELVPDDPDLWQWRAEVALADHRWDDAGAHARRSETLGPKLGRICVRNWMTLRAVAAETADSAAEAEASARAEACPARAPVRL